MQFKYLNIHYVDLKSDMAAHLLQSEGSMSLKMQNNNIISTVNIHTPDLFLFGWIALNI